MLISMVNNLTSGTRKVHCSGISCAWRGGEQMWALSSSSVSGICIKFRRDRLSSGGGISRIDQYHGQHHSFNSKSAKLVEGRVEKCFIRKKLGREYSFAMLKVSCQGDSLNTNFLFEVNLNLFCVYYADIRILNEHRRNVGFSVLS